MKQAEKIISFLLALLLALTLCPGVALGEGGAEAVDYAGSITLDMSSETVKQEVTVKTFVDGDTTHFHVPESVSPDGVLKARYLGINTPESTGMVQEYGKAASNFTREKLENAAAILVESDTAEWNVDSTGGRLLVWVWYKPTEDAPYRNLNIELLQNGLANANSSAQNRYGETCVAAIEQARALKLNLYSGQPDPDFFYGDAIELTLKELRCDMEEYVGKKVAFTGVISTNTGASGVYVESYDAETGLYFGIPIFYGYGLSGPGLRILRVGNESRIVGTVQYYEAGDAYQVAGLTYKMMQKNDPDNIQLVSEGHAAAYTPTDPETFAHGKVTIEDEAGQSREFDYAMLALGTSVSMEGLTVQDVTVSRDDAGEPTGEMTLRCTAGETDIQVRLAALQKEDGAFFTAEDFLGKTVDVKGIVDSFGGNYQIKVFLADGIAVRP